MESDVCSPIYDPFSQYRFTGKETGAEEDDGGARAFDGTEYWRFDNGDRFGYAILARAGVFFVTSYDASTGHYRFWPLYLADDYALPPEVTNGGLIRIALDAGDSCRSGRDGDVRVIDLVYSLPSLSELYKNYLYRN